MSLDDWVSRDTVDAEVRAHIYSLVSAVGGSSIEFEARYVLGDDALACLKDIRRWLRLYDQRLNRHDVARCLAEADVVKGDLCEILALWTEQRANDSLKRKAALASMEVLVPITWPLQLDQDEATVNHHRHIPYLQLAQTKYKRVVMQHHSKILRTAVRLALPSMAEPRRERSSRDNGIISIILYFLRNIALITHPPNLPEDDNEAEISRSATIDAFHYQDIFQLLLTVASSIGDEFVDQDVIVLEILFHLLKGIDVEKLFMEEEKLASSNTNELRDLIQKEKAMLAGYAKHAPTRHNRFGTMIWVKRDDEKVSTVSGQDVLASSERSMQKMDKSKKWNRPKYTGKKKNDLPLDEFDKKVPLDKSARRHLKTFVEEFLDSSFNPLFTHLRKAIENEADRVLTETHPRQFCYLISWFLQAECARRAKAKKAAQNKDSAATVAEDESFALIASVMNQETFILLNRFMQLSLDSKSWQDLNAAMKCFTQILQTVQEMSESSLEDDQEIAENILNRIFYEETTHDRIVTLLRSYKDQGLGYLDACTELTHVFIRMLERYSKQNVDLQVRSRRRARKKAKAVAQANGDGEVEDQGNGEDDVVAAHRATSERKFDFARFQARFTTQGCIDTFVAFTRYYNDLSVEQLKRAHRFFYRVAFKLEMGIMLYRADIIALFNKMIKGPEGLDKSLPISKEWEELVKQVFRRCIKKVQERPELIVEMLFSKIPATVYYLEHGHDKEVTTRIPRPPAELEVKGNLEKDKQIGVAVSLLINQNKSEHLAWVKKTLSSAAEERSAWEQDQATRKAMTEFSADQAVPSTEDDGAPSITVRPDNEERRIALFKDNKLRLLLKILGFIRVGLDEDRDASWIIPPSLTSEELQQSAQAIQQTEWEPPSFDEDKSAEDMVRTKRQHVALRGDTDDEDDDVPDALDDEELFPAGGPTARRSDALKELKKKRTRNKRTASEEPDDEEKERKKEARRQRELEKRRKIKSELFVHSSDEDTDEEADREFFAAEEERRKKTAGKIVRALISAQIHDTASKKRKSTAANKKSRKKQKGSGTGSDSEDAGTGLDSRSSSEEPVSRLRIVSDDEEESDTPLSSQHAAKDTAREKFAEAQATTEKTTRDVEMQEGDDEEDEGVPARRPVRRRNIRAGFLIDSDESE
ncbi:topoisomerase 1-associated factor 1 [Diplodia corticola]|uniref:Topoisomerase 1-associated factor 1 n=1 Tax=Diplodia corticola TaxID=236234 RepID=A0A1J9S4Z9_9PEZI|nr:topoisomerase 1-associated factor 1 [Diplodia corticola]OJD40035.1 topoisomerase 1-associated factor 1 [Diplodia corticola]